MGVSNVLALRFTSDTNEDITINVPRADMALTDVEVRGYMEALIDCDIIVTKYGSPVSPKGATQVRTQTIALDLDM